uniref:Uncharacterized protein n=1 Tax=Arundo donax TaxID=35708 RepID=A0A0A9E5D4_ARUDO
MLLSGNPLVSASPLSSSPSSSSAADATCWFFRCCWWWWWWPCPLSPLSGIASPAPPLLTRAPARKPSTARTAHATPPSPMENLGSCRGGVESHARDNPSSPRLHRGSPRSSPSPAAAKPCGELTRGASDREIRGSEGSPPRR